MAKAVTFKKDLLRQIIQEDIDGLIEEKIVDQRRWETTYEAIFSYEDNFYSVCYDRGSTENQWHELFEYDPDDILVTPVQKVQRMMEVWEPIK